MSRVTLFFFPYAGGSAYSYRQLSECLSTDIEPVFVELPGRGPLFNEPLLTTIDGLAEHALKKITAHVDRPYAIFGHSMGSSIGYKVCQKIQETRPSFGQPDHLFISAKAAPSVPFKYSDWHTYPSKELWEKLETLGGIPKQVLDSKELQSLVEPIVRADFKAESTNCYMGPAALQVPLTVLGGTEDVISKQELLSWQEETPNKMDLVEFSGGHFYLFDHMQEVAKVIMNKLCAN